MPPRRYELRVSRIPGSLQRTFESRSLGAVTLGASGREQPDEKREKIYVFQCGIAGRSTVVAMKRGLWEILRPLLACNMRVITSQKWPQNFPQTPFHSHNLRSPSNSALKNVYVFPLLIRLLSTQGSQGHSPQGTAFKPSLKTPRDARNSQFIRFRWHLQ